MKNWQKKLLTKIVWPFTVGFMFVALAYIMGTESFGSLIFVLAGATFLTAVLQMIYVKYILKR